MFTQRENEETLMFALRIAARVTSVVVFLILLLFYIGEGLSLTNTNRNEFIGLLFFPVGLVAGFALGWHDELWGGIIAICSTAAFYVIYGLALSGSIDQGWAFLVFTIPGALFLLYGLIHSPRHHSAGRKAVI
jgi:integral membrane sensor domain MASE1